MAVSAGPGTWLGDQLKASFQFPGALLIQVIVSAWVWVTSELAVKHNSASHAEDWEWGTRLGEFFTRARE
jgi:hypothetical protein